MNKRLNGLRGAVCSENTKEEITKNVCTLFNQLVTLNSLSADDIVSVQFTLTKELRVLNPATALRLGETLIDTRDLALFCSQEAYIEGGMKNVIRLLVTAYTAEGEKKHNVYLNGAEKLRPDFTN